MINRLFYKMAEKLGISDRSVKFQFQVSDSTVTGRILKVVMVQCASDAF